MTYPTPKNRLLLSKTLVGAHQEIAGHQMFEAVADAALLEYQTQLLTRSTPAAEPGSFNAAAAAAIKLSGAMEFLAIFRNLSIGPEAPKAKPQMNLDHRA